MADFFQSIANWFAPTFDQNATKVACKTAVSRLNLHKGKMQNKLNIDAKNIAALYTQDKEELARIRVEAYMNDEKYIHVCELVGLMCEKVAIRLDLLALQPTVPEELQEAVHTIIYAAPRIEVDELKLISHQLALKYGRVWLEELQFGSPYVNTVVRQKLEVTTADPNLVQQYLLTIVDHITGIQQKKVDAEASRHEGGGGDLGPAPGNPGFPPAPGGGFGGAPGGGNASSHHHPSHHDDDDISSMFPPLPNTLGNTGKPGGKPPGGGNFGVPSNSVGARGNGGSAPPPGGNAPAAGWGGIGGPGFPSLPPSAPSQGSYPPPSSGSPAPDAGDDLDMANIMARFDALRSKTDGL